jgi:hypothetical protein
MPWPKDRFERVGVNSFGIGGANAHVRNPVSHYASHSFCFGSDFLGAHGIGQMRRGQGFLPEWC